MSTSVDREGRIKYRLEVGITPRNRMEAVSSSARYATLTLLARELTDLLHILTLILGEVIRDVPLLDLRVRIDPFSGSSVKRLREYDDWFQSSGLSVIHARGDDSIGIHVRAVDLPATQASFEVFWDYQRRCLVYPSDALGSFIDCSLILVGLVLATSGVDLPELADRFVIGGFFGDQETIYAWQFFGRAADVEKLRSVVVVRGALPIS